MNHPHSKYIISSTEAESLSKSKNITLPQLLPSLVTSAQKLARPPISNFAVGAVGLSSDGRIFLGGNIEFPGLPLNFTIHAEQFLITNLAAHGGGAKLVNLAVSAAPCGHCRQFLQELRDISETQILITDKSDGNNDYEPISLILPNPFGPFDLLDQETPLILEKHENEITLKDDCLINENGNKLDISNGFSDLIHKNGNFLKSEVVGAARGSQAHYSNSTSGGDTMGDDGNKLDFSDGFLDLIHKNGDFMKSEAVTAARGSHAPYSGCPCGVALMDCDGRVYRGSYMESAAYNPSMMPVQAALVSYMVAGGGGYERIVAAVLVEKEGVMVKQEDAARLMLKCISPKCEFKVYHCN